MINLEKIYKDAIKLWGKKSQVLMCVEECSELQKNLLHDLRLERSVKREDILEEIVDVQIMLDQMQIIYGITWIEFDLKKCEKLRRLIGRIKEGL